MPEIHELMDDLPEDLQVDGKPGTTVADDAGDDDTTEDENTEEDKTGEEDVEDDDTAGAGADDDNKEDEDLDVDLEEDEPPKPAVEQPKITDEGQYILTNLPKITTQVIVPGADGKDEVKQVEVYGWGDLPRTMKGFASMYEQGVFTASAQNNELKARELQTEFRTNKIKADTEAYTIRENRAIAKDLRQLRQDGLFPKFKGLPGTSAFNASEGAKEFDKVVAFMNEQNDEAGKAAQSGDAFYHISFRQAYRMLHPEQFDKTKTAKQRQSAKELARRVKTGGGTKPERNIQPTRVSNITDLADEFASFVGSGR